MLALRISLLIALLGVPLLCRAEKDCYAFIDEHGSLHLTNVPDDDRYHVVVSAVPHGIADGATGRTLVAVKPGANPRPAAPSRPMQNRPYDSLVRQTAAQFGIDAALVHAVISVESDYNPNAVSHRGATGLMQLMPETARRYGVVNSLDPAQNVRGGVRYLTDLLKRFNNDLQLALAAYNAGEEAVVKFGNRIPPYPETAAYVPRVVDFYTRLRSSM
jgi:soluble lytic murein transglycosylase-like protein